MISLFLLGLLLLSSPDNGANPVHAAQSGPAAEMFQLINQFRASMGLPPFQYNGTLAVAAQNHANWMASTVIFSHTGAGGSSPLSRATAAGYNGYVVENIVGGWSMSPRQGLIWWQNSPTHYNTLVTGSYPQAGLGFATNGQENMYVLVVGRPPGPLERAPTIRTPLASAAPLIITPIELAEPREDGSIVHVMQQGQAMWTVAAYYDVDLDYLYLINGLGEDNVLHPGDEVTVRLADGQEPPPTPTPPLTHTVREGESAWSIALQNDIGLDYLYLLNNMNADSMLQPGDQLVVRLAEGQEPPPTPTPPTHHVVREGQSLWLIAALYSLTLEELMALNELTTESVIRAGDQLLIRHLPTATPVPPTSTPAPQATATLQSESAVVEIAISPAPGDPNPAPADPGPSGPAAAPGEDAAGEANGGSSGLIITLIVAGTLVLAGAALVVRGMRQ
ncbi:MAG: LysM peptidoglycan-binding domain-containing protein [Chloroflexota bacterium]|nr:MAG: LysM peptidoglycan-binding domain-containing protein [Chloroflexota bacterium]